MLRFPFRCKTLAKLRLDSVFSCEAHRAPIQSGIQSRERTISGKYYPTQSIQIPTRRLAIAGAACVIGALSAISDVARRPVGRRGFSATQNHFREELVFKANRKHIYEILTSAALFDTMTRDIQAQERHCISSSTHRN